MNETYTYEMLYRPPSIGTHPTNGLIGHREGGKRWGYLEYDRELSNEEVYNFDLRFIPKTNQDQEVGKATNAQ